MRRAGRTARPAGGSGGRGLRVRAHHDRVDDADHLVGGETCTARVLAHGLRAAGLVDANRAERATTLLEHVAPDPADVVRHLVVADVAGASGGLLELLWRTPSVA